MTKILKNKVPLDSNPFGFFGTGAKRQLMLLSHSVVCVMSMVMVSRAFGLLALLGSENEIWLAPNLDLPNAPPFIFVL
uniref:Uncharacterized protein n=1 Tax=Oryza meridionalis TaxID=40149 RepID=A0A0E0E0K0_9ORYZ